jgi:hypothetical protein
MLAHLVVLSVVALPLLLVLRVYMVLPPQTSPRRRKGETCSLGVFLGSGE